MIEPVYSFGLLALELRPGLQLQTSALSVTQTEQLGMLLAEDLRPWLGTHTGIDIALAGAAFDPVEILRPGWPVHTEIARLTHLAPPSAAPRLLCFGAAQGHMPEGLQPEPAHQQGPLRWLPFVLSGPGERIAAVQEALETELMERGMAGAATALHAQEVFATAIEHARYMTLHDGVAMMAMQYGHNGLEALWPLIETALFAPQQSVWLDAPPEPLVYLTNKTAHIALLDSHQWLRLQHDLRDKDSEQLEPMFQLFQMRQRQIAAVLEAHGIAVEYDFCPDAVQARTILQR